MTRQLVDWGPRQGLHVVEQCHHEGPGHSVSMGRPGSSIEYLSTPCTTISPTQNVEG